MLSTPVVYIMKSSTPVIPTFLLCATVSSAPMSRTFVSFIILLSLSVNTIHFIAHCRKLVYCCYDFGRHRQDGPVIP